MGITLSLLLISTVSAMLMAGPRVLQVIGQDFHLFRWLAKTNRDGIPMTAIWAVALLSVALVLSSSFESVLVFSGFILALNTFFAVGGIFVLRARQNGRERHSMVTEPGGIPDAAALSCAHGLDPGVHFHRAPRRSARSCIDDCSGIGSLLVL